MKNLIISHSINRFREQRERLLRALMSQGITTLARLTEIWESQPKCESAFFLMYCTSLRLQYTVLEASTIKHCIATYMLYRVPFMPLVVIYALSIIQINYSYSCCHQTCARSTPSGCLIQTSRRRC